MLKPLIIKINTVMYNYIIKLFNRLLKNIII